MEAKRDQGQQWSRHAAHYDDMFLDPFRPGVDNPWLETLKGIADPGDKTVVDLGCGVGPLLPFLVGRFGRVIALDFAPGMISHAKARLGDDAGRVTFLTRPMHELGDLDGQIDVAVAVNSVVMPDTREIDRTLRAVRAALRPAGIFVGVVPAIDAIHYQTMLLMDRALDLGREPIEAEREAAHHAEHTYYDFAIGRFEFRGLRQKFWHSFELQHRLKKAGFGQVELGRVLYPWDDQLAKGPEFADQPPSWDWSFAARP